MGAYLLVAKTTRGLDGQLQLRTAVGARLQGKIKDPVPVRLSVERISSTQLSAVLPTVQPTLGRQRRLVGTVNRGKILKLAAPLHTNPWGPAAHSSKSGVSIKIS